MTTTLAPSPGTVVPNISPGTYSGGWAVILRPPQSLTALQSSKPPITGLPATAWATGSQVTFADASTAYWNGTAWVTGTAP
jgi:hypothetical protein